MQFRLLFSIFFITVACVGGGFLYKNFFISQQSSKEKICIYSNKEPGVKEDVSFIKKTLKLYNIRDNQIVENPKSEPEESSVKIFFDQSKFDAAVKQNDSSFKIAIRLKNNDEETPRTTGVFLEDKSEALLEFMESIIKHPINCILFFDDIEPTKQIIDKFQELAKIKNINLKLCQLKANCNIATVLKAESQNVNAVILVASPLVMEDSGLIFEYFNSRKIPVFANHVGLIRNGAIGGFDFDTQEIAHSIAEVISNFFKNPNNINSDLLDELYPQLHLNMDVIAKLSIELDPDILDEAITVGGADL